MGARRSQGGSYAEKEPQQNTRKNRGRFGPLFKLLCAPAVVIALTIGATVFFQVETIAVTGNSRYTQQEVIERLRHPNRR